MTGQWLHDFGKDESGQDMVEYSLLLGIMALAIVALLAGSRDSIQGIWTVANNALATGSNGAGS